MKHFFLALFIFAFYSISYGQNQVVDNQPEAQIYVIDPQSNQETPVNSDVAILLKNSLIDLVAHTYIARAVLERAGDGMQGKVFTVTQMGPETNVNGFQITLDQVGQNQNINIYTFVFHADNDRLYYFEPGLQTWQVVRIVGNDLVNLRRAAEFSQQLNNEVANQQPNGQLGVNANIDLNQPVDADVAANVPPPAMPEYQQPECPADGYLWQPGYWAYAPGRADYYWVPGAWVAPPRVGVMWTPPYWGYEGTRYVFHVGYWGDHIGFYGGINYGYGYGGRGYYGGEWNGGHFRYNTAVVRVNTTVVHNTYINRTVINNVTVNNHNSFNGRGGVEVKPTSEEVVATHETHIKPTAEQNSNQLQARQNPSQFTKNAPGGKPANLATPKIQPFQPQNVGGNGKPALGGRTNNPQGTNPGRPGFTPARPVLTPGKPLANPGKPGLGDKPVTNPANPGANPNKPVTTPGKPLVNPGNPGANPDKPVTTPVKPVANPGNPGLAPTKPVANPPVKPAVNPAKPVANPGQPGLTPGNGNKPKDSKPKKDTKPKPKPVTPPTQPANQ